MTMDEDIMAVADDRPGMMMTSDMIGLPMGQLRTANKRRNRALARAAVKPVAVAAPAKAVKAKAVKSTAS